MLRLALYDKANRTMYTTARVMTNITGLDTRRSRGFCYINIMFYHGTACVQRSSSYWQSLRSCSNSCTYTALILQRDASCTLAITLA
eukprot:20639-Heterococcus_DN1.PRE.4